MKNAQAMAKSALTNLSIFILLGCSSSKFDGPVPNATYSPSPGPGATTQHASLEEKSLGDGLSTAGVGQQNSYVQTDVSQIQTSDPSVKQCLANMGIKSIDTPGASDIKYIETSGMSPNVNSMITDEDRTANDRIVVVNVHGFGPVVNIDLNFLNPKGIYCLKGSARSVFTNRKITICRQAQLGDDQVQNDNKFNNSNIMRVDCAENGS